MLNSRKEREERTSLKGRRQSRGGEELVDSI